ncbi:hypothetical protein D8B20_05575 [Candidatus Pantoea soli]|uniref:Uncharacterized protein n=1 Tax=Candidatus Pantoea soli TaxID=3098669 RepID=A0A518XB38_9GAMM|nr:hypothetical protein D8B20_05575 [Pantoea soli]
MLLNNSLILMAMTPKPSFAAECMQAAYFLACARFSVANTQGYPQEWWITESSPAPIGCV